MSSLSKLLFALISATSFAQVSFTTSNDGTSSLIWNGTEYNYKNTNEGPLNQLTYGPSNTIIGISGCTRGSTANTVTWNCTGGIDTTSVTTYTATGSSTITASMVLTNNDATNHITAIRYTLLGFTTSTYDSAASRLTSTEANNPVSMMVGSGIRIFTWMEEPKYIQASGGSVTNVITHTASGSGPYFFKNLPTITCDIGPGESITIAMSMRFTTDMVSSRFQVVPEAYSAVRTLYPQVTNWPDRRPIAAWFLGEYSQRSAINPRGYFQNASLDVSNQSLFNSTAIAKANELISGMSASAMKPQGIILWDIEGQEFRHATTYIGDPRVFFYGYAPEMNAIINTLMGMFRTAGFRVGVTIRPQRLAYGTSLPGTCIYNADPNLNEYYVLVDQPYLSKFYDCDPSGTSWSIDSNGSGSQTGYARLPSGVNDVLGLLRSKIQYARSRWGATLFYLDSAVFMLPAVVIDPYILRTLQAEFPDCLILAEQEYLTSMAATVPWTDPRNGADPDYAPVTTRWVYQHAALWPNWSDCTGTCWTNASPEFQIGLRIGDIPATLQYANWYHYAEMESIWTSVNNSSSSMNFVYVTDSSTGKQYSFKSAPKTSFTYPVVSRVYFASSSGGLAGSATYCEAGTNPSQDAFQGSNSCSLNLSGLGYYQIRYYDFAGNLVSNSGSYGTIN